MPPRWDSSSRPSCPWTREDIVRLAPDHVSVFAAEEVLRVGGFSRTEPLPCGRGWSGICRGLTGVYQTSLARDLDRYIGHCTCPSPKNPCKHVLALMLYLLVRPERLAEPWPPRLHDDEWESLLRAVFDNPDDDTARLVFADFLDERGQSDRATLIRIQCETNQRERASNRYRQLVQQQVELVTGPLQTVFRSLPRGINADLQRGFLWLRLNCNDLRRRCRAPGYAGWLLPRAWPVRFQNLFRDGWIEAVTMPNAGLNDLFEENVGLFALAGEINLTDHLSQSPEQQGRWVVLPPGAMSRLRRIKVPWGWLGQELAFRWESLATMGTQQGRSCISRADALRLVAPQGEPGVSFGR